MTGPSQPTNRAWRLCLAGLLLFQFAMLCIRIGDPLLGYHEWGSTIWCQSAHNNLRAGLSTTMGVPTGLYCGPLPIPANGYFIDHPPGVPLAVTLMFAIFGEHEWAGRLVPILCSLVSTVLLWWLVRSAAGERIAALSVAVFVFQPMELYFGRVIDHEACGLMWMLTLLACLRQWQLTSDPRWQWAALGCCLPGMWTAWPVYILAGVIFWLLIASREPKQKRMAWLLFATGALAALGFLIHIRLPRPDAWDWLYGMFRLRLGSGETIGIPWGDWALKQIEFNMLRFSPTAWGVAIIGAVVLVRRRNESADGRWLGWLSLATFLTALLWIVVFRNGSYIHSFWSFYFLLPVAVMGGVGLNWLTELKESNLLTGRLRRFGPWVAVLALVLQAGWGVTGTWLIHTQPHVLLDEDVPEPPDLVPRLGEVIREAFPQDTFIIANLPHQSMPLEYYAKRNLIYFRDSDGWLEVFQHQGNRCRGLVWLDDPAAGKLLASLPGGERRIVEIGSLKFCLWTPE